LLLRRRFKKKIVAVSVVIVAVVNETINVGRPDISLEPLNSQAVKRVQKYVCQPESRYVMDDFVTAVCAWSLCDPI
jgi:flagellar motor switch protein FliM